MLSRSTIYTLAQIDSFNVSTWPRRLRSDDFLVFPSGNLNLVFLLYKRSGTNFSKFYK
jgi:hypothetical protein